jgi:small subunit ribosomal protein S10
MQKARIRLSSTNIEQMNKVVGEIKKVVSHTGVKMYGPVPLPTRHLAITTQKSPCGEGTTTWERYQMRIHKRLIDINADDRSMTLIMKIMFPEQVLVEIELV